MAISIQNLSKRMQVYNLPHASACTEEQCHCTRRLTGVTDHDRKTGKITVRALKRRLAGSITLAGKGHDGDTLGPLPDSIGRAPDILAAKKRGDIKVGPYLTPEEQKEAAEARAAESKANLLKAATQLKPAPAPAKG